MGTFRVLVIEDEAPIRRFLRASLESQGAQVIEATTGAQGLALAGTDAPDVILLDLGLPDIDGIEVVRRLRAFVASPIIIISARGQEADKVAGLDAGADDYLTKPFGVRELLARVRVALRHRTRPAEAPGVSAIDLGRIHIDLDARRISRDGAEVKLTPNEWKLLAALVKHAGKVVTQKQLLKEVWGTTRSSQEHSIRVYMHQLRQKLEDNPADPRFLITEPWVGYRLVFDSEQ
ncbi:MAG: response regulator [Candidatus Sumerlaeia bacterium]|nr:response regulator [Candidatus Sumerlaeia bacterium]